MSDLPPEARLWNLIRGALGTKALGIAADLGVADALADGPRSVTELAPDCQRLVMESRGDGVIGVIDGPEAGRVQRLCTQGRR